MSAVIDHGLCVSGGSWTPEDQAIARRRVPLNTQAYYVTQDLSDLGWTAAALSVSGSVRKQVCIRVWLEEHDRRQKALAAAAPYLLAALETTRGNIRSLGPAGALDQVPMPYRAWLAEVDRAIAKAEGQPR